MFQIKHRGTGKVQFECELPAEIGDVDYGIKLGFAIKQALKTGANLAGDAGKDLERRYGSAVAGALIYAASRPGKRVPNFYASTAAALADLRGCAAEEE